MIGVLFAALLQAAQPRDALQRLPGWASNGPDGGSIYALATSDLDPSVVYAGAGGLFKSEDGGASWRSLDTFPRYGLSSVILVGVAPSNPNVVYAAESVPTIHFHSITLYRSEDAGATWTSTGLGLQQDDFFTKFNVAIDPSDAMTLYASINCCSSKSTDGGRSATPTPPNYMPPSISSIAIDPTNPSRLYGNAFVEDRPGHVVNHLQKSVDAGTTWAPTGLVTEEEFFLVDPEDPNILYAPGTSFGRSDDGGLSISTGTTSPGPVYSLAFGGGTPRRLYARVAEGFSIVLYTSLDRGATWSLAGAPPGGVSSFAVTPLSEDQDRILAGSLDEGGVFLSNDGGAHWEARSAGLRATDIGALAVLPTNGRFAYALGPGLAKTSDGGATWSADPFAPVATHGGLAVHPTDPAVIYAADATAGIRRSVDGGATWSEPSTTGKFVNSIAVDSLHPTIVYAADGRPLKSIDGGATWQVVNAGIPDGVTQIRVDPANDEIVYAISTQLYRSANAGRSWTLALDGGVISVVPDPGHPGTVYASASYLLRSLDYGSTWEQRSFDVDVVIDELACDANGILYAAGRLTNPYFLGLTTPLRSGDGGTTWHSIGGWENFSVGLPFQVSKVAVDLAGSRLFAGTERGVWDLGLRAPRESPSRP